jgi:Ca2+-transporting ATPase
MEKYHGLTREEAASRLARLGPNELEGEEKSSIWKQILAAATEPMLLLLAGTATLYFFLGQISDALVMLVFVFFVSGISIFQEWKTQRTISALRDLSSPKVTVIRDSETLEIPTRELVEGDIFLLYEGERVAADGKLLEASDLLINESILTGEAEAVSKDPLAEEKDDYWQANMCYAGTQVVRGSAVAEATSTGPRTEYGKIGEALDQAKLRPTPLEIKTRQLVRSMATVGLILCLSVIAIMYAVSGNWLDSILGGITLAMAMIPEEFPVVLTVFLALGAWRLARKEALARRIPAVETLGAVTVLCVDKTGTITKNQMEVRHSQSAGSEDELLVCSVLASEIDPYDPMEQAFLQHAKLKGTDPDAIYREYQLVHEYSFERETKMMGHIWRHGDECILAVKGSPETVLPRCQGGSELAEDVQRLARRGWRVLAFAKAKVQEPFHQSLEEYSLEFVGLLALADPPREGVAEAIAKCQKAGIRIKMITGDYGPTAEAIGHEVGILDHHDLLLGDEIDSLNDEELMERVDRANVFARVRPEHKLKIVRALRARGEVVGMTGDGVNDAPALKEADIGIAMGKRGSSVAREAADLVLLNDDFTTIARSVRDGRRIFDNIRKAMSYILVIHFPIAGLALLAPLFKMPLLLLPIHVVLLELIIDPTCSIVFEAQGAEPDLMRRPPRDRNEPIIKPGMFLEIFLSGLGLLLGSFLPYKYLLASGLSVEVARSFALATMLFGNILLVTSMESNYQPFYRQDPNPARLWVNSFTILALVVILYSPFAQRLFMTGPLSLRQLLQAALIAGIATLWRELVKWRRRRKLAGENV